MASPHNSESRRTAGLSRLSIAAGAVVFFGALLPLVAAAALNDRPLAPAAAVATHPPMLAHGATAASPTVRVAPVVSDTGYVISSDVVVRNCGACHARDDTGRMGRISYLRKTPEGWQTSIRRMVSLHGVNLQPDAASEVLRYLANTQGLAPEELSPGLFEVERRMDPFSFADGDTEETCTACHSMGRIITQRRASEEWELLIATHRALFPLVDRQIFFDGGSNGDSRHPVERAVAHLSERYPLETPEWSAWSANLRPARIEGVWALSGREPGRGRVFGTVEIQPAQGARDEFTTTARYVYGQDGTAVQRTGEGLVYTGYQWRGRSTDSTGAGDLREVMSVERGWEAIRGRWFRGAHDEFGLDVTLERVSGDPVLTGIEPYALRAGQRAQEVRVFGANLPSTLAPESVDLGPGIRVTDVVSASPESALLTVELEPDARVGARDAFVDGVTLTDALVLYDRVDALRVTPANGMARIGGEVVPRQYQQFEAIGYQAGPDGESGTDDDLELGPVPVEWSIEEYPVTYEDDDVRFVGQIDERGLFTPNVDGPNPERSNNRNNMGEVWAVATYADPSDSEARVLQARAYLIVTAPIHLRWEQWPTQ
ncbi:MAG: quinohemoprotein amine dehydrogenase subunit alpha [Gemmatimonadota bacterium]